MALVWPRFRRMPLPPLRRQPPLATISYALPQTNKCVSQQCNLPFECRVDLFFTIVLLFELKNMQAEIEKKFAPENLTWANVDQYSAMLHDCDSQGNIDFFATSFTLFTTSLFAIKIIIQLAIAIISQAIGATRSLPRWLCARCSTSRSLTKRSASLRSPKTGTNTTRSCWRTSLCTRSRRRPSTFFEFLS